MPEKIRVVLIDDHPLVRKGLRQVLEEEPDLDILGEANDGEAGLALIEATRPSVAILDLHMPKLDGFAVGAAVALKKLPVDLIFLTFHSEVDLLHRAMDVGAKGYILKENAVVEVVSCVRSVAAGRPFVSPSLTAALLVKRQQAQTRDQTLPALSDLTPSERRILGMIASGKSTKLIAAELRIHPRTVESHRSSICQKLQLNGTNSLLRFVLQYKDLLLS